MSLFLSSIYFFLPTYLGNSTPVFVKKIPFLNYPIDFFKTFRKKRILGDHKTWRGLVFGCIIGFLVFYLQQYLYINHNWAKEISLFDYSSMNPALGFLMPFGALIGDAVESFFKRQKGIKSGGTWWLFDQIDFVIGCFIFVSPLFIPELKNIIFLLIFSPILSFLSHRIGYYIKILDTKQ